MPQAKASLFKTDQLTEKYIGQLFSKATDLKKEFSATGNVRKFVDQDKARDQLVLLMFLEPSTRTRLSFETAALRLGLKVLNFDESMSSLKKGETQVDSFRNVMALAPNLVVVRHGEDPDLEKALGESATPIISGGQSAHGHPTQALLDLFTLEEEFKNLNGKKILLVGDVRRGRAAISSLELIHRFCGKLGWVGPKDLSYEGSISVERFSKIEQGLAWADAVIGFRLQNERTQFGSKIDLDDYAKNYCLNPASIKSLGQKTIIMHPGPFNQGIDFDEALLKDPRCRVLHQVTNGLFVRMALLGDVLNLWRAQ